MVLDILSSICLLEIRVEVQSKQLDIQTWYNL